MFASLAKRLTAWYVFVAMLLLVLVVGASSVFAFSLFARATNEAADSGARVARDYEARARSRHESFDSASHNLLSRLARPGLRVRIIPPGPRDEKRILDSHPLPLTDGRARALYAFDSLIGVKSARVPFMGGIVFLFETPDRIAQVLTAYLVAVVPLAFMAALLAWILGRVITSQALRPLIDVTESLERFALGDFTPRPIDTVGKNEFAALARAYNGAALQVAAAFAEREAAEAQMRQFVADAGHELRTPLTVVLGFIEVLKKRIPHDDARTPRIFELIALESNRMRTLIDNLMLLTQLDAVDERPPDRINLGELVRQVAEGRHQLALETPIALVFEIDATVSVDRFEMHEAVGNLIENAIKYAPGAPIRIVLKRSGADVELVVSDGGPGIAASDQPFIYDRFYRGLSRGDVEGSGLGLAIAKRAVERSGGRLELRKSDATGTVFAIVLPAVHIDNRAGEALPA